MPSLQALVASADNYLGNQNSEGALTRKAGIFSSLQKENAKRINDAKRMQQSQLSKCFQMHN